MAFIELLEPAPRTPPKGMALWALGFRPFYLLAALWALLAVPLWAAQFAGWIALPGLTSGWHAREMVFGYTLAVVVGFLFTAGRNWSGQPTPSGGALAALAALWVAARVAGLTPWPLAAALLNAAFAWAAAWGLWRALRGNANRRNDFFVGLLVLIGMAALAWRGTVPTVALDAVVLMMAVMGGRVIPMFSNNAVPTMQARREPRLEQAALAALWALLALDVAATVLGAPAWLTWARIALLTAAALLHAARLALWQPLRTRGVPLLWVLHLAYAWLVVHLLLRAAGEAGWVIPSLATHALTVGAIGGMTLGMMTRTALGHTARPLRAGPWETAAYVCMALAAVARVVVPLLAPALLVGASTAASLLWATAFALYLVHYTPILMRPRLDGKPG